MTTASHDTWVPPHTHILDQYLRHLAAEASPRTVRGYTSVLRRAHAQMPYGVVIACTEEITDWLAQWQHRKTRAMYRSAIVSFFTWAIRHQLLDYDPTGALPRVRPPSKLPRPCSHAQLATILTTAPQPVRTWSLLAAYAGLRCIEVSRLRREDISEASLYVLGKGDRERILPTHPDIWAAVRDMPAGLVAGVTENRISGRARTTYARLGVATTMHRLRDWYGTYGYAATGDLRAVQHLMGHASPRTTASYIAVADGSLRAVVTGLPQVTAAAPAGADPAA